MFNVAGLQRPAQVSGQSLVKVNCRGCWLWLASSNIYIYIYIYHFPMGLRLTSVMLESLFLGSNLNLAQKIQNNAQHIFKWQNMLSDRCHVNIKWRRKDKFVLVFDFSHFSQSFPGDSPITLRFLKEICINITLLHFWPLNSVYCWGMQRGKQVVNKEI